VSAAICAFCAFALGACTPQIQPGYDVPPCAGGSMLCPMTGQCQPVDYSRNSRGAWPVDCQQTLELRQGARVFLSAPGASLEDLSVGAIPGDAVTASAGTDENGWPGVWVTVPHGSPPGDAFGSQRRVLTIATRMSSGAYVRSIPIIVSYITAASNGVDSLATPGTLGHPFATLQWAAKVADAQDTIVLRSDQNDLVSGPGHDPTTPVNLPPGVTVKCIDDSPAALQMQINLGGNATFESLRFNGPRISITKPRSQVVFVNDILTHGLTVDTMAGVEPNSPGTEVTLSDHTVVFDERPAVGVPLSPLDIVAVGARVTVDNSYVDMTDASAPVDTIALAGKDQSLTLSGGTELTNTARHPALNVTGAAQVTATDAKFFADLVVSNTEADVMATRVTFDSAAILFNGRDLELRDHSLFTDYDEKFASSPLVFHGRDLRIADSTLDGGGLALPAGQDVVVIGTDAHDTHISNATLINAPMTFDGNALVIAGATTFKSSLLSFGGTSLAIADAVFSGQGIRQAATKGTSTATLQNVQITDYTHFGYKLGGEGGTVLLEHSTFLRDSTIVASGDGTSAPWALQVDAAADSDSSVRSLATSYDGVSFMPSRCDFVEDIYCGVVGPRMDGNVFSISPLIKVAFAQ
jgi:hypothetical protein